MGNACCCSCSPCQEENENLRDVMQALDGLQGNMDHIDELIAYIDQILNHRGRAGQEPIHKPTSVDSFINSGRELTHTFSRRLNRHVWKKCLMSALDRRTAKVVFEVGSQASQAQPIPYVGMAFSIIAHLLERSEQESSNNEHINNLLRSMCDLAKHMKNLGPHLDRTKMDEIVRFLAKGTLMCALQMEPKSVCRFCFAPLDAAELESLKSQLDRSSHDLALTATTALSNTVTALSNTVTAASNTATAAYNTATALLNTQPNVPGPSQGEYPHNAVGVKEAEGKINKLLDLNGDESRRVVVIYGVGGIGKTTLATAVFHSLDLTGYVYCRVDMDQDSRQSDLLPIQEQILHDVFKENLKLRNCTQGREKLSEAFGKASKPVFLFIDNALRQSDLEMLLPIQHISRLPIQSRILVTTRNLNETNTFELLDGVKVYPHMVDSVLEPEAKRLLCHYALANENANFDADVNIDELVQICGGIPLVLKIVGSQLRRRGNTVSACHEILEYIREWQRKGFEGGEENLSESMVDFVYRRLKEPSKEALLDIVFFFHGWERSKVGDIVGEMELEDLERAALVTTSQEDVWEVSHLVKRTKVIVKVHDIVRARGRKLSEGNRINDRESSVSILLGDEQKLEKIKGIWLRPSNVDRSTDPYDHHHDDYDAEDILEAKHLNLMCRSLRVLCLGRGTRVNGQCERAFEDLRFLNIWFEDMLPIDPTKSSRLVYFRGIMRGPGISQAKFHLPESLRLLYLYAKFPVWLDINELTSLRELASDNINLSNIGTFVSQLKSLRVLLLMRCECFTSIPETLGNFSCLKLLLLLEISKLERLTERFGNLSSIQHLNLGGCSMLEGLPESFGNLCSLESLDLRLCSKLERLPDSFGNLSSLKSLHLRSCSKLERLPDSFGNLSSMQNLDLSSCSRLEKLPESFGNLSSMQNLHLRSCSKLEKLPESFGNLSSMQTLDLSSCSMLEKLPESFGNLSSMQKLYLSSCSRLEGLPQAFDRVSSLQELKMEGCEKLCSLFDNFGQLKSLKYLNISECKELKSLPEDIVCLTALVAMRAYGCAQLEAKAMDSLVEIESLMFLEMGESPMLIKRWEQIQQQHLPLIGAALRFEWHKYPYEEIMSVMLFNGGSRFLHVDGEGQLASSSFPDVGVKVGLFLTACDCSNEMRERVGWNQVASAEYQIIYVDVDVEVEGEAEEEREKRIRKTLLQLPEGSRACTFSFHKTSLLFAYSLCHFTGSADTSIVGTSVVADEEGRRKLSQPLEMIFRRDGCDSRRVDFTTLFSPLKQAWNRIRHL